MASLETSSTEASVSNRPMTPDRAARLTRIALGEVDLSEVVQDETVAEKIRILATWQLLRFLTEEIARLETKGETK
jgi:hypothetical protein